MVPRSTPAILRGRECQSAHASQGGCCLSRLHTLRCAPLLLIFCRGPHVTRGFCHVPAAPMGACGPRLLCR